MPQNGYRYDNIAGNTKNSLRKSGIVSKKGKILAQKPPRLTVSYFLGSVMNKSIDLRSNFLIRIIGMADAGKTMLLKRVCNLLRLDHAFNKV